MKLVWMLLVSLLYMGVAFAQNDALVLDPVGNSGSTTFYCSTTQQKIPFTITGWDADDNHMGAPTWSATCLYNCTNPNAKGDWSSYGGDTFTMTYLPPETPNNTCNQTFSVWDWTITVHDGSTVDKYITVLQDANEGYYISPDEDTEHCGGLRVVFVVLGGPTLTSHGTWAAYDLAGISLPNGTFDNTSGSVYNMYGWTPPTTTQCGSTQGTDTKSFQFTAPDGSITSMTMHLVNP